MKKNMTISPKLGRVRSASRSHHDPAGLWSRLTIGSIVVHGLIAVMILTVSYRVSEARRASADAEAEENSGAIEIDVIAVSGYDTKPKTTEIDSSIDSTRELLTSTPQASAEIPLSSLPPIATSTARDTSNPLEQTDISIPESTATPLPTTNPQPTPIAPPPQTPTKTPTATPSPNLTPTPDPSPTPSPTSSAIPAPENNSSDPGNNPDAVTDRDPDGRPDGGDLADNDSSTADRGNDAETSTGNDRLGLIIRLDPQPSNNPDPDHTPAQLTAPTANIDLPITVDPELLPEDLAPPLAIALQVELSIDPTGKPSLVRILEPDGDRELPQFESFVKALIDEWRFEPASSVANGLEVDQFDILLALQWL